MPEATSTTAPTVSLPESLYQNLVPGRNAVPSPMALACQIEEYSSNRVKIDKGNPLRWVSSWSIVTGRTAIENREYSGCQIFLAQAARR